MAVHPIEFRYAYPEMKAVWEAEHRLQFLLEVEIALARAHARLGRIPSKAAEAIAQGADGVTLARVREIEEEIDHETMAMVRALAEASGDAGGYVHLGATSSDILDTALALQLRDTTIILDDDLASLLRTLLNLTEQHADTVMPGRTHGQHALPITFGFKTARWADEVDRHRQRLRELQPRLLVGKVSGAVGSFAGLGDSQIQSLVMQDLGLGEPRITSQVVSRDRHAEFVCWLGVVAGTLDTIAREIRNLARTEIKEVEEPFGAEQVGSSTMPHKRNPHKSERICGLARLIRGWVAPALETIALEHERDLSNSSVERALLPEACILTDYLLRQTTAILAGLRIYPENMIRNLARTEGLIAAEAVMLALTAKGLGRQEAYELVRHAAWRAQDEGVSFRQALLDADIDHHLDTDELDEILDPLRYTGQCTEIARSVVRELALTDVRTDQQADSSGGAGRREQTCFTG